MDEKLYPLPFKESYDPLMRATNKGKGSVLVFKHKQVAAGKRTRDGQEHKLHQRLLTKDYLIDTLGAKSRAVSSRNRKNARRMEDYLQTKLLQRDLGTQRLFQELDKGNMNYIKDDEYKTFRVLVTTLNAEKVQEELDNGILVINR